MNYIPSILISMLILALLGFSSCSNDLTPDEEIYNFIALAEKESENKDLGGIKKLIANDYSDKRGYSKQDITRIAAGYFLRNQSINILSISQDIEVSADQKSAQLSVLAAVSRSPLDFDDLRLLNAEFHAFEIILKKDDRWLLKSLEWKKSNADTFVNALQ